jgi:hypothetical protein
MWAELFCLSSYLPDSGFRDRSEAREWTSDLVRQAAPPLPRFPAARVAPSPPHMRGRGGTPWGSSASQPPVEFRPYPVPPVGGWSRLGASFRPQIGRWDRRQCHMPDFWVTGRPINPLNASVATFCAEGVISMHQTPHHHPARAWSRRHPLGVVDEPVAGRFPSVPPRGWLQPARGEFPAPNSPLGPPPVPHDRFLGHWEAHKSVECARCDFLRSGCD